MGFQADGKNGMSVRLAHEQPASYPFVLRYGEEQVERLAQPFVVDGDIVTPWRTVVVAPDLNTLVNTNILYNLSPEPDPKYFPEGRFADWLQPGRAVWGYLTTVPRTLDGMKHLSKLASDLGFEYHVVEGHWARWPVEQQKELIEYSRKLGVRVMVWKHSKDLWDPEKRLDFFNHIHSIGAIGAKLDFFDHEAKELEELYLSCLQLAAERQLVLNFHGASKPAGEAKTWPNELTREAIKGFEMRGPWAKHNVTVPFTRMVAGHADYTPLHFGDRKAETTDAHQIASAIIITAPLLIYAGEPADMLQHAAVDVIKQIPSVWDETIVLEPSAIGELAVYARRKGDQWFLAVMNGTDARSITIDLSFLGKDRYGVTLVRDKVPSETLVSFNQKRLSFGSKSGVLINTLPPSQINDRLIVDLLPAGGFVAVFDKMTD
jgi:alpha-glucosidase